MEGFPSFKGAKLNASVAKKLQNHFKNWSMFTIGKTKTHITPNGGIHFSGKLTETMAISFEIKRGNAYIMISLFEYPKGVVFHAHIYYPDISRKNDDEWKKVLDVVYNETKSVLLGE